MNISCEIKSAAIIEERCFSEPWTEGMIRSFTDNGGFIFMLFDGGIGYLLASCVMDECELLRVAVLPEHRKKGIAGEYMSRFVCSAREKGIAKIFLEVRESNTAAINLYIKHGFKKIASRKGYYHNPPEDAIIMENIL